MIRKELELRRRQLKAATELEFTASSKLTRVKYAMSTSTKISGLTPTSREKNLMFFVDKLKENVERCAASNVHLPHKLKQADYEDIAGELEYKCFTSNKSSIMYTRSIATQSSEIKKLTAANTLHAALKVHVPKQDRNAYGGGTEDLTRQVQKLEEKLDRDSVKSNGFQTALQLHKSTKPKLKEPRKMKKDSMKQSIINHYLSTSSGTGSSSSLLNTLMGTEPMDTGEGQGDDNGKAENDDEDEDFDTATVIYDVPIKKEPGAEAEPTELLNESIFSLTSVKQEKDDSLDALLGAICDPNSSATTNNAGPTGVGNNVPIKPEPFDNDQLSDAETEDNFEINDQQIKEEPLQSPPHIPQVKNEAVSDGGQTDEEDQPARTPLVYKVKRELTVGDMPSYMDLDDDLDNIANDQIPPEIIPASENQNKVLPEPRYNVPDGSERSSKAAESRSSGDKGREKRWSSDVSDIENPAKRHRPSSSSSRANAEIDKHKPSTSSETMRLDRQADSETHPSRSVSIDPKHTDYTDKRARVPTPKHKSHDHRSESDDEEDFLLKLVEENMKKKATPQQPFHLKPPSPKPATTNNLNSLLRQFDDSNQEASTSSGNTRRDRSLDAETLFSRSTSNDSRHSDNRSVRSPPISPPVQKTGSNDNNATLTIEQILEESRKRKAAPSEPLQPESKSSHHSASYKRKSPSQRFDDISQEQSTSSGRSRQLDADTRFSRFPSSDSNQSDNRGGRSSALSPPIQKTKSNTNNYDLIEQLVEENMKQADTPPPPFQRDSISASDKPKSTSRRFDDASQEPSTSSGITRRDRGLETNFSRSTSNSSEHRDADYRDARSPPHSHRRRSPSPQPSTSYKLKSPPRNFDYLNDEEEDDLIGFYRKANKTMGVDVIEEDVDALYEIVESRMEAQKEKSRIKFESLMSELDLLTCKADAQYDQRIAEISIELKEQTQFLETQKEECLAKAAREKKRMQSMQSNDYVKTLLGCPKYEEIDKFFDIPTTRRPFNPRNEYEALVGRRSEVIEREEAIAVKRELRKEVKLRQERGEADAIPVKIQQQIRGEKEYYFLKVDQVLRPYLDAGHISKEEFKLIAREITRDLHERDMTGELALIDGFYFLV